MSLQARRFENAVVVVTGAAGGIGRAIAERFGAAGAIVVGIDVDAEGLAALEPSLGKSASQGMVRSCDITSLDECTAVTREILERFGRIDVLVNNAGVVHRSGFRDTDVRVFRQVMDVNYFGSLHVTKAMLEPLLARRGLVIVVSSVAGVAPLYGRSGYSASKHALHGLFESLRAELADAGLEVLMVCPSFTRSRFEQRAMDEHGDRVTRGRSRVGSEAAPEEVARAIFDAACAHRRLLVLSLVGKLSYVLSRFAPELYERLMVQKLKGELA